MSKRYALYFAPHKSTDLHLFGSVILGRTPSMPRIEHPDSSFSNRARWKSLTKEPAHYGFHATLKAPFELNPEFTEQQLLSAVDTFAKQHAPIPLDTLAPRRLSHFLALTLDEQPQILTEFALLCVELFEAYRQPLSTEDIQRRLSQPLTPRQKEFLESYGYPYVGDEYRFHMTLSGELPTDAEDYEQWVCTNYQQIVKAEPILDQIAVFTQPDRETAFTLLSMYPLTGKTSSE